MQGMLAVEDILVRWKRMSGFEVLWLPGTDHAAIATENVVISKIQKEEGIANPRQTLGREKLLEQIHDFVASSRDVMRQQIRAMGASCDWSRERFTMDSALDRCVTVRLKTKFSDKYVIVNPNDKKHAHFEHEQQFECEWIKGKITTTLLKSESDL